MEPIECDQCAHKFTELTARIAALEAELTKEREVLRTQLPIIRECSLDSGFCHDEHNWRCKWLREYHARRPGESQDSSACYERAQKVGCDCGLWDESRRLEEAVVAIENILTGAAQC